MPLTLIVECMDY